MQRTVLKLSLSGLLMLSGCNQATMPDAATSGSPSTEANRNDHEETMPASNGEPGTSSGESLKDSERRIALDGITLDAPATWESKTPGSPIIAAEFVLPRADGDDADGRLTISTAGGTVEANIDRWKGQVDPPPQQPLREEINVAGLKITVVDFTGDFNDQRGPFAPAVKRPSYRMIAAVIPVDSQLHFIKATGPQNTIAKHAEAIHEFIRSVQPTN
jgi:hypothetical protein